MKNKTIVGPMSIHKAHELLLKFEDAGLTKELVQEIIQSEGNELAIKVVKMVERRYASPAQELEEHNFRVDSTGWGIIKLSRGECKVNPAGDIWEILKGEYEGEQLFTWKAAMRETKKAGKVIPSDDEFSKFLKTRGNMPNPVFAGLYHYNGFLHDMGEKAIFWSRTTISDGSNARVRWLDAASLKVAECHYEGKLGFSVRCLKCLETEQAGRQKIIKPGDTVIIGIRDIIVKGELLAREVARGKVKSVHALPDDPEDIGEIVLEDGSKFTVSAKTVIEKIS